MAMPAWETLLSSVNHGTPLPGPPSRLFDERTRPDFREVYGGLLRSAAHLDVALTRIRLSSLDMARKELARLRSIRLLLAEVNAVSLELEAHTAMLRQDRRETLVVLTELLTQGGIEVRSAPLAGWVTGLFCVSLSGGSVCRPPGLPLVRATVPA